MTLTSLEGQLCVQALCLDLATACQSWDVSWHAVLSIAVLKRKKKKKSRKPGDFKL